MSTIVDESRVQKRSCDSGASRLLILLILFAEITKLSVSSPAEKQDETEASSCKEGVKNEFVMTSSFTD